MSDAGGLANLVRRIIRRPEGDVVGHGIVKEDTVLRHQAELAAQRVDVHVADGMAVEENNALCAIVETRKEVDQGGLSGS